MNNGPIIPVTKPYLPKLQDYIKRLEGIWDRNQLTNNGPLVKELENRLENYLGVNHCILVTNGTMALHMAIQAFQLKGEIITTPFSFVATTSSIVWEKCKPVFADIDKNSLNLDPSKIEEKITNRTSAILATHVYGNPCEIEQIETIAKKHQLKVIYDGAHGFGTKYKHRSLLSYGDVSTVSFHATKVFSTVEGGAIITHSESAAIKIQEMRNFGLNDMQSVDEPGTNAKNTELHAAFGLCVLDDIGEILTKRMEITKMYDEHLKDQHIDYQQIMPNTQYNYAYYPLIFKSEEQLEHTLNELKANHIYPRRYFYPSLNKLPFVSRDTLPIAEDISKRVFCLPLYHELNPNDVILICNIIKNSIVDR